MKRIAILTLLLSALSPLAVFAETQSPEATVGASKDLELVYQLAVRPVAVVQGDKCEIRGAVWGYGPRAGVKVALFNVLTGEKFTVTTNAAGIYALSTPYPGVPVVYAEHMDDVVFVKKEMAENFKVAAGGVVCDHRLTTASTQPPTKKETK